MKLLQRPGLLLLWTLAAVLLLTGLYATRSTARASAPARPESLPVQQADTAAARQQRPDTAGVQPSGPPTSGVGGAVAPIDSAAAVGAAAQQQPRSLRELRNEETPIHLRFVSLLGIPVLLLLGWLVSANRRLIPWRIIAWGIGLQFVFALIILKTPAGAAFFGWINDVIVGLLGFTTTGARFLFGNLVDNNVPVGTGEPGMGVVQPIVGTVANTGAFFAFSVLPTIVFFSSLMTLMYYFGVMQAVVRGVAWVMMRTMRTSGAETLSAAGNIFLGQTEAPLLIKPYVASMTMSELMAVMTGGMATVAGGVMAAFVGMLVLSFPDIAGHLMAASVMSAPAALVFAKLMYPETEEPATRGELRVDVEKIDANPIDAAARGAGEGMVLAFNVGAMLLAFIALIALINALLGWVGAVTHFTNLLQGFGWLAEGQSLNLEWIMGWLFAPLAWIMGVPWVDAREVGTLLGVKTIINEFVAYLQLGGILSGGGDLSARAAIIATYALCGFANFSSIGIQIGGIGGIAPSRRSDLARLGLRAMIAGTLASFMTATIAGILI